MFLNIPFVSLKCDNSKLEETIACSGPSERRQTQQTEEKIQKCTLNAKGEFEFFAGPGDYYIIGPRSAEPPEFRIQEDQTEHVVHINTSGPERIQTRGAVVLRGNAQERIREATVYGGEKSGVALKAEGPLSIFDHLEKCFPF